jgi:hypothetical protein
VFAHFLSPFNQISERHAQPIEGPSSLTMPPKRPLRPLYKNARDYYKGAYRARIKAARTWNNCKSIEQRCCSRNVALILHLAQITSTLAWMWLHASEDEKNISIDLHGSNAQTLPDTDDANIPETPKRKDDPAPEEHEDHPAPEEHRDAPAPEEQQDAPALEGDQDVPEGEQDGVNKDAEQGPAGDEEPPKKKARVNTTAFPFWPDPNTINDYMPEDSTDLMYPGKEDEETRWRGAHFLGGGATGRVGLWVKLDDDMLVEDVCINGPPINHNTDLINSDSCCERCTGSTTSLGQSDILARSSPARTSDTASFAFQERTRAPYSPLLRRPN